MIVILLLEVVLDFESYYILVILMLKQRYIKSFKVICLIYFTLVMTATAIKVK